MFELTIEDKETFKELGYIKKNQLVNNEEFINCMVEFRHDLQDAIKTQNLKLLGGYKAGNLNINIGKYGPIILEQLKSLNFEKYFNFITEDNISNYKILYGGNLNLFNSKLQLFHTDGKWNPRMIIVNIASMDITSKNGPIELIENSHNINLPYWRFLIKSLSLKKKKINLSKGELLIREHRLWHRGTTNLSGENREMLGIMLLKSDKIATTSYQHSDKVNLFSNMFDKSFKGKLKEYVFVNFKFVIAIYQVLLSILK